MTDTADPTVRVSYHPAIVLHNAAWGQQSTLHSFQILACTTFSTFEGVHRLFTVFHVCWNDQEDTYSPWASVVSLYRGSTQPHGALRRSGSLQGLLFHRRALNKGYSDPTYVHYIFWQ